MKGKPATQPVPNPEKKEEPSQVVLFDPLTSATDTEAETLLQFGNIDDMIKNQVLKYHDVIPDVEGLKTKYLSMKILDLTDDVAYQNVSVAYRDMVKTRNDIERKRKELKADSLKFGAAVDAEAKKLTELIAPIETHLRTEKEKVDAEKERIEKEKEELRRKKLYDRHELLCSIGMFLVIDTYSWRSPLDENLKLSLHPVNLETMEDEDFNAEVAKFKSVIEQDKAKVKQYEEELRLESERQKEEQRMQEELLAEQRRMQEQEAERIRKQQEELENERKQLMQMRYDMRINQVASLGLIKMKYEHVIIVKNQPEVILTDTDISELSETDWRIKIKIWELQVIELKQKEADFQAAKQAELIEKSEQEAKINAIKQQEEEDERLRRQQQEQEDERIRRQQEEEERLRNLSDKELVKLYAAALLELAPPVLKTAKWKKEVETVRSSITQLQLKTS